MNKSSSEKVTLNVEGMSCNNCAAGIKKHLEKNLINEVNVNFSLAEVTFSNNKNYTIQSVIKLIESIGYKVKKQNFEEKKFLKIEMPCIKLYETNYDHWDILEFLKEKNFSNDDEKLESSESFLLNLIRFISERKITFLSLTIFSLIILTYFIFNGSDEKNKINALEGISSEEQVIYENEIISDSFITEDENTTNNVIDDQIVFEKDPEIPIIDIDYEEDNGNISLENGSSDIEIIVQGESWVEIIDDEQILLFELLQTGFYEVTGYGPFKFKIGHSPSVKIYLNGNNIDFSKTVSKYTDYAHFLYKEGVAVELFKD